MIWVIGGTSDAIKIADLLVLHGQTLLVSTTTEYGSHLAGRAGVEVLQKKLEPSDMLAVIGKYGIQTVVDASHPFAQVVSHNAMAICDESGITYIRYERQNLQFEGANYYSDYPRLMDVLKQTTGNVLLTIGSKNIGMFRVLDISRLVARVLPVKESIDACENAGLKAHQIIAMKGRMSKACNKALLQEYNIMHLVTKDSGEAGGMTEKVNAALELGLAVHILNRPIIHYPICIDAYHQILNYLP